MQTQDNHAGSKNDTLLLKYAEIESWIRIIL